MLLKNILEMHNKYKMTHNDLYPKNILLNENLTKIFLIDFG